MNSSPSDPITSHIAESKHRASGALSRNCAICLEVVRMNPGLTAAEIANLTTVDYAIDSYEANRRLADLKNRGVVKQGGKRKCGFKGTQCVTWILS